jgi:hypothetical protein
MTKQGNEQVHTQYKFFMVLFMAQILDRARKAFFPSDLLFIMTAKISRRMIKLGNSANDMPWLSHVEDAVKSAQRELTNGWDTLQQNLDPLGCSPAANLAELRSETDTHLSLRAMRGYHKELQQRNMQSSDPPQRIPQYPERIKQDFSAIPAAETLKVLAKSQSVLWLVDLELWVQDHLQTWLVTNLQQPSKKACSSLGAAIALYHKEATLAYKDDPERFSFMVITLMDLWVALDKCAALQEPLLLAYETGFPNSLFDPLLLPKKGDMVRLFEVEEYLEHRRRRAFPENPSIFLEANRENSFPVQYFEQSYLHQRLKQDIEKEAASDREKKIAELAAKKTEVRIHKIFAYGFNFNGSRFP